MDKYTYKNMLEWLMIEIVSNIINNVEDAKNVAIRFEFRHKNGGAIALIFNSANYNRHYIGVYAIDRAIKRVSGKWPLFTEVNHYRFISDHDCAVRESVSNFLSDHDENIEFWDFINSYKVIILSEEDKEALQKVRKENHRNRLDS